MQTSESKWLAILQLSDLRDLCKDPTPKGLQKVYDYLAQNPGMDLIGKGHGGSIRASINSNNPEALKVLLKYHRDSRIDIHEVGTKEYNEALYEFRKALEDIILDNWNFKEEKYIFSDEVKAVLDKHHSFGEDDEQDLLEIDAPASPLDYDSDGINSQEDAQHDSAHNSRLPSGEITELTEVLH